LTILSWTTCSLKWPLNYANVRNHCPIDEAANYTGITPSTNLPSLDRWRKNACHLGSTSRPVSNARPPPAL
jgi:hypothetical protein